MTSTWADEFKDIPAALEINPRIRERMISLIDARAIPGKVTEGTGREAALRKILTGLAKGETGLAEAIGQTETELCPDSSPHADSRRIFCHRWAERLLRTQFSRFYNQAVMEHLLDKGETEIFIQHSSEEDSNSKCAELLAGRVHSIRLLYDRLQESYERGNWNSDTKIPDHPHCTHVVKPTAQYIASEVPSA